MCNAALLSPQPLGNSQGGSDAAIETADVVLMSDDLSKLPWLIHLSRRTLTVIRQNIGFSLAVKVLFVALTFVGFASLWAAIATDASKVNTREEGWKDLKIAVISKRPTGKAATPDEWDTRVLPGATIVLAFAMIATSRVFCRTWRTPLRRLGVSVFASVHALGDGASWIWKSVNRVLTGCKQTQDIYHACERLNECAQRIFGETTAAAQAAFEQGRGRLLHDGWSGVCVWVAELLAVDDVAERERRRKATDRLLNYFAKHSDRLNYRDMLAQGKAIGSGVVEGQAKTLGLRMKCRGTRWNRANVRSMASLVCVRNSTQWDAYWSAA